MRKTRGSAVIAHDTTEPEADNVPEIQQANGVENHVSAVPPKEGDPLDAAEPNLHSIPSEVAQEVWESLKEEFYEPIEQLPLYLHRSFTLIGEQDREAQSFQNELLPTIRSYIKFRQSLEQEHDETRSETVANNGELVQTRNSHINGTTRRVAGSDRKYEDSGDVIMAEIDSHSPHAPFNQVNSAARDSTNPHVIRSTPHSSPTRLQNGRENDATIPKSVPFPPRPKPKTLGELLTRITFLTSELLRASDEKVGLATVAYDLLERHVGILNAAIKECEVSDILAVQETAPQPETTLQVVDSSVVVTEEGEGGDEEVEVEEQEEDEDEEPQLGMIGPAVGVGVEGRAGQRMRKSKRKDKRKYDTDGQTTPDVVAPDGASQELTIDPDEPRYCYCNQVSYGEMIACDNPDCNREWFHLGCAGLTAPPKGRGKWYCRDCEEEITKVKKRKVH